jgi:hypothetical protein
MVHGPKSGLGCRLVVVVVGLMAVAAFSGCDWLFFQDTTPPVCQLTSPADSAAVNGAVLLAATATDSFGVAQVEFFVDDVLVLADSASPYTASWNSASQPEGSWHRVFCVATDSFGNKGYSDTVSVQVVSAGQWSIFHGELEVKPHTYQSLMFHATSSDTLAGDVQVVSGGTLPSFMWLDSTNYRAFVQSQSYSAIFRRDNAASVSLRQQIPNDGRHYLVFSNPGGSTPLCWARFVLE